MPNLTITITQMKRMNIIMNVKNLHEGQIFKNYKELCSALEIVPKEGNSKIKHFNDLGRWCEFEKDGRKFIIKQVFDKEKERIETRGGSNNSIYGDLIQLLILELVHRNNGFVSLTRDKLFEELGMTNVNYRTCKSHIIKLADYLEITPEIVLDFYNVNGSNFKKSVVTALDALMDKRVLFYNTVIKIKVQNEYIYRDATTEELSIISLVENKTLEKMEYRTISEVRNSPDWNEFKQKSSQLIKGLTEIDFYFTAYDIYSDNENIEREKGKLNDELMSHDEYREHKVKLNKLIIENIDINALKRHEKAKLQLENNLDNEKEITYQRAKDDYTANINSVADKLITLNKDNIVNKLKLSYEQKKITVKNDIDELFN